MRAAEDENGQRRGGPVHLSSVNASGPVVRSGERLSGLPENLSKQEMRIAARARRQDACDLFGARIGPVLTANLMAAFSLPPAAVIAGYSPMKGEADIMPLLTALAQRGHRLCLPAVTGKMEPLAFRAWKPGDSLPPGYQGIPEPPPASERLRPDVVLVPLLAYDPSGHRLGYGGGFYDRTLAALRADGSLSTIGIAFSAQEVDRIPGTDHDQRLDAVLTELGVVRFGRRGVA